ncbi:hypothetical protein STEG23_012024 [Scotinomys teguina]
MMIPSLLPWSFPLALELIYPAVAAAAAAAVAAAAAAVAAVAAAAAAVAAVATAAAAAASLTDHRTSNTDPPPLPSSDLNLHTSPRTELVDRQLKDTHNVHMYTLNSQTQTDADEQMDRSEEDIRSPGIGVIDDYEPSGLTSLQYLQGLSALCSILEEGLTVKEQASLQVC